jgi:hypothetical protein
MRSTMAAALARHPETEGRQLTSGEALPRETAMTQEQCASSRRATSCERTWPQCLRWKVDGYSSTRRRHDGAMDSPLHDCTICQLTTGASSPLRAVQSYTAAGDSNAPRAAVVGLHH